MVTFIVLACVSYVLWFGEVEGGMYQTADKDTDIEFERTDDV